MESEAFVLIGGKSSRMGVAKSLLPFGESTLLGRAVSLFEALGLPVRLLSHVTQSCEGLSRPVLVDLVPDAGPLGAICTGLLASESPRSCFLACDMPLARSDLFHIMLGASERWDAVVPVDSKGKPHPLSACYSKRCLPLAWTLLEKGERRVNSLLENKKLRVLRLAVRNFGVPDDCFLNVNTPNDYKKVQEMSAAPQLGSCSSAGEVPCYSTRTKALEQTAPRKQE